MENLAWKSEEGTSKEKSISLMNFLDILPTAVGQISHYFCEKNYDIMNYAVLMNYEYCFYEKELWCGQQDWISFEDSYQ